MQYNNFSQMNKSFRKKTHQTGCGSQKPWDKGSWSHKLLLTQPGLASFLMSPKYLPILPFISSTSYHCILNRTAERTVYIILNLSWFFFSLLSKECLCESSSYSFVFKQLKKKFYIFTLTCCPPHSIVLIVLFSDLYLCLETSNFLNKNKPAVCCKFDLFESRVEEE